MSTNDPTPMPQPTFAGGTTAITRTPVVGTPRREYAETFVPGAEPLEDGELRVTVLGSGNPWATRAQASASILVEVGNPERDLLVFDLGTGSLANYASLKLPVNLLDKVFLTHLHADHTSDMITLCGSYAKVGRADGPVRVWGPSGTEPRLGTKSFCDGIEMALAWDTEAGKGPINEDSMRIEAHEFDWSQTAVMYEANGVKVTSFPVVHALTGAVGYRLEYAGLSFSFSGDACASWPLVHANEGGVDLLVHECFPPAAALAAASGSVHRAGDDRTQRRTHVSNCRRQGLQPREAAHGGTVAHAALAAGHPDDRSGAADGLRRSGRTDSGPHGVQRDQGGCGRPPGPGHRPAASYPGQAARGVHAFAANYSRVVGRGAHTAGVRRESNRGNPRPRGRA